MTSAIGDWRKRRATQRVRPGDGRALPRFRWWQLLSRSLFSLTITDATGRRSVYAVDVRHMGNATTGEVEGKLYLDNTQLLQARLPAVFPVDGGTIEVVASPFGLKRCHYVLPDGSERQLEPDPRSAEGLRARLDRSHPALSRAIGMVSLAVLIAGLAILIPQLLATLSQIPPVADTVGSFSSPIRLATVPNIVVTLVTAAASSERALRLRHNWLLDGGAG
jgi:hypothetical protein